jgi:hypothetical protein
MAQAGKDSDLVILMNTDGPQMDVKLEVQNF